MEATTPAVKVDPKFLVAYRKYYRIDQELGVCNEKDEKANYETRVKWRKLGHEGQSPESARCLAKRHEVDRYIADRWGVNVLEYFQGGTVEPDTEEFYKCWGNFKKYEVWTGTDSPAVGPVVRPGRPVSEFTNEGWIKSRLADEYEISDMSEFLAECETVGIKKEHARVYVNRLGFRPSKAFVRAKPIPRPADFPDDTSQ